MCFTFPKYVFFKCLFLTTVPIFAYFMCLYNFFVYGLCVFGLFDIQLLLFFWETVDIVDIDGVKVLPQKPRSGRRAAYRALDVCKMCSILPCLGLQQFIYHLLIEMTLRILPQSTQQSWKNSCRKQETSVYCVLQWPVQKLEYFFMDIHIKN